MCGRFALLLLPPEAGNRLFRTVPPTPNAAPSWNIAPSQEAMAVRRHPATGERHLDMLRWGLLPSWTREAATARRPINARTFAIITTAANGRMPVVLEPADWPLWLGGAATLDDPQNTSRAKLFNQKPFQKILHISKGRYFALRKPPIRDPERCLVLIAISHYQIDNGSISRK